MGSWPKLIGQQPGWILRLHPGCQELERKFESELDESRIRARVYARHLAERGTAHVRVGRGPLVPVERVKEFGSESDPEPFIGPKRGFLEYREVPVVYARRSQRRVCARFTAISKVRGSRKTRGVEPLGQL